MKAGGCVAGRQWRRVEQPARKTESHLEVPRHDVSLLLGLGGYTYNSFKPPVYSTPPVACSPRSLAGCFRFFLLHHFPL